jgi:hypothetical protein
LIAASFASVAASAQSATPPAPAAAPKPAANVPAPASGSSTLAKKPVVSPYARAASQRERVGQAPVGHAATTVQGMGKPHKSHTGAPPK